MFTTTIHPRFHETDAVGHINNTVPPAWLEFGRTQLFDIFFQGSNFSQWPLVVKTYTLTFEHEMHYGEPVRLECEIARIGNTSMQLNERIYQGDQLCVKGSVVYVHLGEDRRPAPIPAEILSKLQPHFEGTRDD